MNVLFVTSEIFPLIKTGGLADVSGALPRALRQKGLDVRILVPGYPAILRGLQQSQMIAEIDYLPEIGRARLIQGIEPETGNVLIAIQCSALYERDGGPYLDTGGQDWPDNALRFGILSRVAAILASDWNPISDWPVDIVHCNDWQTGLTPAYLHYFQHSPSVKGVAFHCAKSILSIHNLAFQGSFSADWLPKLGLPTESFSMHGVEYYGRLSFLKAGIYFANLLSTVSPTYAKEIQTEAFGFGMQGLLTSRSHEIHGILNGIDTDEWNPAQDIHLEHAYSLADMTGKASIKLALQKQLGLYHDAHAPLLGIVSRLSYQKGLDLFLEIAPRVLRQGAQIALLGSGDAALEHAYRDLANRFPHQVSTNIGYNEPLSHRIMAGADLFIMPSRFEPCGLNQMYGLRYGTPPVVNRTGGLADSVVDTTDENIAALRANGFVMPECHAEALWQTVERALACYHTPALWQQIQQNGMQRDWGWNQSAEAYIRLYQQLLKT